jgi:hypothetical protein
LSAFVTRARTHVKDPITADNHLHIMLYNDDGVACGNKVLQLAQQAIDIIAGRPYGNTSQLVKRRIVA